MCVCVCIPRALNFIVLLPQSPGTRGHIYLVCCTVHLQTVLSTVRMTPFLCLGDFAVARVPDTCPEIESGYDVCQQFVSSQFDVCTRHGCPSDGSRGGTDLHGHLAASCSCSSLVLSKIWIRPCCKSILPARARPNFHFVMSRNIV